MLLQLGLSARQIFTVHIRHRGPHIFQHFDHSSLPDAADVSLGSSSKVSALELGHPSSSALGYLVL